ncbi:MAG: glucose-6-phosphate isomerase [Nitrospirae bacterium 13_2_20CM_62_7]|nr:MAG: glucose-6-phosphate isomerase [Nitrospirae bacterium 13_2_20CM_62_7]
MPATQLSARLGVLQTEVDVALEEMAQTRVVARLWRKDHTLWKPEPREIENRLGWLTVAEEMQKQVGPLREFAESVCDAGFSHVVLLGMGGSSLGPEVLRSTFGSARGFPRLWVLDSTVPGAVREVTKSIRPARTLFILASKSGGTVEVMSLFSYFWNLVMRTRGNTGGAQFIAITDHGTSLISLVQEHAFRTTFINPSDIGGAALLGLDLDRLVGRRVHMARACGPDVAPALNPGASLGAVMGKLGRSGRDKVTLITSPTVRAFGLWAEQLLAESTGKEGKGLIPIAGEPIAPPECYGNDRLFVHLRLDGDANADGDRHLRALERAGQPVLRLTLHDRYDVAAQFFCWEFATAVASHVLGVHPFDQPNVQESKENTSRILKEMQVPGRVARVQSDGQLADLLAQAAPGRYLAILAYLRPSMQADAALSALRKAVLARSHLATTAGYGPRYLHSTGQLHKGGPETGLFLQLLEEMTPDLKIPDTSYTFGTLAESQAVGDRQALEARRRPVVLVRLGRSGLVTVSRAITPRGHRSRRVR